MKSIKKAGILAGAITGGIIGGTVSVIGKLASKKTVDNVGESVVDSMIYAGNIAGNLVSGAADLVAGNVRKDRDQVEDGLSDLKNGGKMIVENWLDNTKLVLGESGNVLRGARDGDKEKVGEGLKTIVKLTVVGALTVGAIKLKQEIDEDKEISQGDLK